MLKSLVVFVMICGLARGQWVRHRPFSSDFPLFFCFGFPRTKEERRMGRMRKFISTLPDEHTARVLVALLTFFSFLPFFRG